MICQLCQHNPISAELQTLSKRSVCVPCATAIAEALPRLKTQPCRRQTICMRLQERGLSVMSTRQEIRDLVEWGVSDEQLMGACDIAKERGKFSFGYVYSILKNEREQKAQKLLQEKWMTPAEAAEKGWMPKPKEDWERLGFANQADYEAWQFAYDKDRRSGRRITEAEHRRNWLSEAV